MKIIPKEISWLSFNERVLHEAQDNSNPIYDRIRFLGIYSNNLDEFFRVRVATLKRLVNLGNQANKLLGYSAIKTLEEINKIVLKQHYVFQLIYRQLILELKKYKVYIVDETQLSKEQYDFVEKYFLGRVRPLLIPVMLNQVSKVENLEDNNVYLAVEIKSQDLKTQYALLNLPTEILPRFIELPCKKGETHIIFLDDIIRVGLNHIFYIFNPVSIEAYTIKITKDAEIDISDDISQNYIEKVQKALQQRKKADTVRFIYDSNMPPSMLNMLLKKLNVKKNDTILPGDRYHNLKDLLKFPKLEKLEKTIPPPPIEHPLITIKKSILEQAIKHDILLYFPYHSFNSFIDLLREASISPEVQSISITLYRLANPSNVVNALINAVRNGKNVTAFLELQARFDEQNNIHYANKLRNEGVKVHLGIPGLKIHAKLCYIEFKKNSKKPDISCISSGNFNGQTAQIYTDVMLITSKKPIVKEVVKVFDFMKRTYDKYVFRHLLVSPINMRTRIEYLIKEEIKNAQKKLPAYIDIKLNNIADDKIIKLLYKASKAGVKIRLNVRAMCSLAPDKYPNIEAQGIVDYYLEHSRIFIFCNNNNPRYFIGSSDLMTRNLDTRVEVLCPVYDENIKRQLQEIFDYSWNDNIKARIIDNSLSNKKKSDNNNEIFRSQFELYNYFKKITRESNVE